MKTTIKSEISNTAELLAFRWDVRNLLVGLGCAKRADEAVLLALTELGTNLIRHGSGGTLEVELVDNSRRNVSIRATNEGKSIAGKGGLGIGLDSLKRLAEGVRFETNGEVFAVIAELDLDKPHDLVVD